MLLRVVDIEQWYVVVVGKTTWGNLDEFGYRKQKNTSTYLSILTTFCIKPSRLL